MNIIHRNRKGYIVNDDCLNYLRIALVLKKVIVVSCPPWGHGKQVVATASKPRGWAKGRGYNHAGSTFDEPEWNEKLKPAYYEALNRLQYILFGANWYFEELTGRASFETPRTAEEIKKFIAKNPYNWIVWDKKKPVGLSFCRFELAYSNMNIKTEVFSYLYNGLQDQQPDNRYRLPRIHPTEKPWGLMGGLISKFTPADSAIIDPFGGSMSVPIAVNRLPGRRRFVGIEIDPVMARRAAARFKEEDQQGGLF